MQMTCSNEKNQFIFKGVKSNFHSKASHLPMIILATLCVICQNFYIIGSPLHAMDMHILLVFIFLSYTFNNLLCNLRYTSFSLEEFILIISKENLFTGLHTLKYERSNVFYVFLDLWRIKKRFQQFDKIYCTLIHTFFSLLTKSVYYWHLCTAKLTVYRIIHFNYFLNLFHIYLVSTQ